MNELYATNDGMGQNSVDQKKRPLITLHFMHKMIVALGMLTLIGFNTIQAQVTLNLSVDMRSQTVSPNGVHVAGTFNGWSPTSSLMEDNNQDGIYQISIPATAQTYEYKFVNGNAWGTEENVFGSCEVYSNRITTVGSSSVTMPTVCFGFCSAACVQTEQKLACVGNSITWGHGVSSLYTKTWPAQMQSMLGAGYGCENLGVSGRTMMKSGDSPWWNEPQFVRTFIMQPDVIFIKLGTNDSKSYNWNGKAEQFRADCKSLIDTFRTISSKPDIYLLTPAKAYSAAYGIDDNIIQNEMIPILRQVALEKGVHVIDMHSATSGMAQNFPDGVHPNDEGARVIAQKVYNQYKVAKPVVTANGSNLTVSTSGVSYQWYLNGIAINGATQTTYSATQNGKYKVSVKLNNVNDDRLISNTVSIGSQSNTAPQVSITSPANGSAIIQGSNIVISANASDSDGSVAKVEFYNGASKLGEDLSSPYTFTWVTPAVGSYSVSARAIDNLGLSTNSSVVLVSVVNQSNIAPQVSITAPTNNSSIVLGNNVIISANASDADGTVAKVEFFSGTSKLGEDLTSPYSFNWISPAVGSYSLTAKATDNAGAITVSSAIGISVINPANAIPGKIEAENWIAMSGVQTENTMDTGGGLNVGYIDANDWMDYTVSVGSAGIYAFDVRYASTQTAQLQILSGAIVLGTTNLTNTNGWQIWQTQTINISLNAGNQTIRIKAMTNGFNINWFNFSSANIPPTVSITSPANGVILSTVPFAINANAADANGTVSKVEFYNGSTLIGTDTSSPYSLNWSPSNGTYILTTKATDNDGSSTTSSSVNVTVNVVTGQSIPGKIEAESWSIMSGIQTENTSDTGGGLNVGWIDANDWLDYSVNVATAGTYAFDIRYASTQTAQVQLLSGSTVLGSVNMSNTGGWQTWQTAKINVALSAGSQTLRIKAITNGFNFNWMNFATANALPTVSISSPANGVNLTSLPVIINANASDADGTITKVEFYNGSTLIGTDTSNPYSFNWSPTNGTYTLTAKATDNAGGAKTSTVVNITVNVQTGQSIPGKIESESWSTQSGIQNESTSDAGGGMNVGWIDTNDWMDYTVNVATAGTYSVQLRIASVVANTQCQLLSGALVLSTVNMPNTGGAQIWQTISTTVNLSAGSQTLRFLAKTNSFNINWMNFTLNQGTRLGQNEVMDAQVNIYPNPSHNGQFNVQLSGFGAEENVLIQIIGLNGQIVHELMSKTNLLGSQEIKINANESWKSGIYVIRMMSNDKHLYKKLILK